MVPVSHGLRRTELIALCALALLTVAAGTAAAGGEAEFEAGNVTTDLEPGMTTRATVDIANAGSGTVYDAEVNAVAEGVVDGASAPRSPDVVGDLEPGETHTVDLTVSAGETVSPGEKPLTVSVTYRNESGGEQVMENANLTIHVMERQRFSIVEFEETLTVGYDGEIRGVLYLAVIPLIMEFGLLLALGVIYAYAAAVLVLPSIVVCWFAVERWIRHRVPVEDLSPSLH